MKKILRLIIIIPVTIGVLIGVFMAFRTQLNKSNVETKIENIFGTSLTKNAEVTKFFTYGTSLNIEGRIPGISKDNYEGMKIIVTDGDKYNKEYKARVSFDDNNLIFSLNNDINNAINLEELQNNNKYYIRIRLKVNNSKDYRYYLLSNVSEYKDIDYYTLTRDGKNNKVQIKFEKQTYNDKEYKYLGISVNESKLPEDVYDFAIDAGHGGQKNGEYTEAALMLSYAKNLKESLEAKGYKVKLTRDDSNTSSFTHTNMYDDDGRIGIACKTHAKYMISLHTNDTKCAGVEVYAPNNSDLSLAKKIADNICAQTNLEYSSANSFKQLDGVYVRNFRKGELSSSIYEVTVNTPYLYTIREVGGIATNAYVDGRNPKYSANKYYKSNQGIECYVVSIGDIDSPTDLDTLVNQRNEIVNAIADSF